jgi:two-component system response regulator DctR
LVVEGLPNKLIADQLDISVRTVEVHRSRVFDKMEVKSAVELANLMRTLT